MDIGSVGPIEQLTYWTALLLGPAFATFPNHDADGNVIGVPVVSFYAEQTLPWPNVVVRVLPGATPRSGIGNISEVNLGTVQSASGLYPGQTAETVIAENALLEFRLGARNEVERERLVDFAYRAVMFRVPVPEWNGLSVLDALGGYGIIPIAPQQPILPDINLNPTEPRPQGMPPFPGTLFVQCRAEFTVVLSASGALVYVVPPTFITSANPSGLGVNAGPMGYLIWDESTWNNAAWG